ncbi:thiol reductant ABC exporter subunit CydD [Alkalihalobacillus trypoxylicola]|uniref:ABC transporter ATP-binding protein n=1 Tax=Alkalihalobacillus trypoxylicola TaxID=519424 RepID=A0A161PDL2_9BACI|nr:thiol reductant ABC exporter subunit CydD [Alkalihalobacillus trypoxylicola]KYG26058.1 ABC transporter ATP-binding protein [Alkalihalobacillus trypoxylicola]
MLKEWMKPYKSYLIFMVIFSFVLGLSIVAQAYLIVTIIDAVFLQQVHYSNLLHIFALLVLALLTRTLFRAYIKKIGIAMAGKIKTDVRLKLLRFFTSRSAFASKQGQSGQKTSHFMDGVDELDGYYSQYIPQAIQSVIVPLMIFVVILFEHWATAAIIVVTAPFIPIFMVIIGIKTGEKSKEQLSQMAAFSGTFLDTLQGLPTLKLFGKSKEQKQKIEKSSLSFRDATMEVLKVAFTNSLALEFISMLSVGLIALEIALRMIIVQDTNFFTGFLMLILAPEFFTKLKELGSAFHTGKQSSGAAQNIEELLAEENEPTKWGEVELNDNVPPALTLSKIQFGYGEGQFQSVEISLTINRYERVAIIGPTGAGKSTLLNVIAGIFPIQAGEYEMDSIKQKNVKEASWYSKLSYIAQDAYLFSGTLLENIALGHVEKASETEMWTAIKEAGLLEWVQSLPQGLQTPIGEGGRGLSGGEKQRVIMARAFLKQPQLVLFDEPTTGLDVKTEKLLQNSMLKLAKSATIITVAHRLHTIRSAHKIILLNRGGIQAIGTHNELLASEPLYRKMVTIQEGGGGNEGS